MSPEGGNLETYKLVVGKEAAAALRQLPKPAQKKVLRALEKLQKTPKPAGVEKLSGHPDFFRLRAGEYRILYTIRSDNELLVVLVIRHRKDAYKGLENLDHRLAAAIADLADTTPEALPPPKLV